MIDLFSGAGGMTLGFIKTQAFRSIFAVELDSAAAKTYSANLGAHVLNGPIQEVDGYPPADIMIGGPPCQGFSPLGRDRDDKSRAELNSLWRHYVRAVKEVRPQVFVIENVPQFLASGQFQTFLRTVRRDERLKDYQLVYGVLKAEEFGVPQRRRRGIVIGSRGWPPFLPPPTHGPDAPGSKAFSTVRAAFAGLPLKPTGGNLHFARNPTAKSIERYKAVPEGGNRFDLAANRPDLLPACWRNKPTGTTDVFGRLWWDRPALTIRTEFFKPEKGRYLHPKEHRPITHREAARLQTFPDDFFFEGSKTEIARQIGNAVPPLLAEQIAHAVLAVLERRH